MSQSESVPSAGSWPAVPATGEPAGSDRPRAVGGILDTLDLPVVVVDLAFTVTYFNRAAATALELAPSCLGRSAHDLKLLATVPELEKLCAQVIEDNAPLRRDVSYEGKWFVLRAAPYSRDGIQVSGAVLTLTNVTAFRASIDQSVYEREFTKLILNTVVEPLVVLDSDLRVQTVNRAFYTMFQVSREEVKGVPLADLRNHTWHDPNLWVLLSDTILEGKEFSPLELEHDLPAIGRRTLLLDARLLSPATHPGRLLLLSIRDITERKQAEEHLRGRETELARAADALRDADRKKDQFLAVLAHELRNPLGPMRHAAEYLKRKEFPTPELTRSVDIIEKQVTHMARLIDDLLDVSRISRGRLELRRERLDFAEIADAAVEVCRNEIEEHGHALRVELPDGPVPIDADRHRLIQVLCNLMSNATKYTRDEGRIEFIAQRVGDELEVLIRDNGIGIPPDKLSDIFELFAQVDRSLERQGGLGIGLALARDLVKLHAGTIEARSAGLGHGSTIVMKLPIAAALAVTAAPPRRDAPVTRQRRVLVADDNKDSAECLGLLLEFSGHTVRLAHDGEAALAIAAEFLPEVALMDIGMPRMNGYDVARCIRENAWGKSMHLIAITGWGQEKDRRLATEAGFNAHIVKPVSPDVINQLLLDLGDTSHV